MGELAWGVKMRSTSGRLIEGTKAHHSYSIGDLGSWDRTLNKWLFSKSFPLRARLGLHVKENFLTVRDEVHLSKRQMWRQRFERLLSR